MAWSWSHTQDAYESIRNQIHQQEREWLEVVWAEWVASEPRDEKRGISWGAILNIKRYNKALVQAKKHTNEVLADFIWEKTQEYATCSNGGFEAYCCPFDCGCHELPFSPE